MIPTRVLPPTGPVPPDWFNDRGTRYEERDLQETAPLYQLSEEARVAVEVALSLGEPLLVTGDPGTGKTHLAYHLAYRLGVEPVLHFQVQSTSVAKDLRYRFDDLGRFLDKEGSRPARDWLTEGALWKAILEGRRQGRPQVLLIDEIDKAPRDLPNDLLNDLDRMAFDVPDVNERVALDKADWKLRPVVVITSNLERELPRPFLRRCIHCHLRFDEKLVRAALEARAEALGRPDRTFVDMAVHRFWEVRERVRTKPGTAEFLLWFRALRIYGVPEETLKKGDLAALFPEMLVKDPQDLKGLGLGA